MLFKNDIKILLIDTFASNISCLRVLLKFFGINYIRETNNIETAENLMKTQSFNIIFIGSQLCHRENLKLIRKTTKALDHNVKVIAFNDDKSILNSPNYSKSEVDIYLPEPFNQKSLYNSLDQIIF